jgi:hypothetical protein
MAVDARPREVYALRRFGLRAEKRFALFPGPLFGWSGLRAENRFTLFLNPLGGLGCPENASF